MLTASPQQITSGSDTAVEVDALVAFCKASADQLRLQILRVLRSDSFGVLELIAFMEDTFQIAIQREELKMENFETLNSVLSFLDAKRSVGKKL